MQGSKGSNASHVRLRNVVGYVAALELHVGARMMLENSSGHKLDIVLSTYELDNNVVQLKRVHARSSTGAGHVNVHNPPVAAVVAMDPND